MTDDLEPRLCLWCQGKMPETMRPQAVWCQPSCGVQASVWRARHRIYRVACARLAARPRVRLWLRPRTPNPAKNRGRRRPAGARS